MNTTIEDYHVMEGHLNLEVDENGEIQLLGEPDG